jgi:hypothetical protein
MNICIFFLKITIEVIQKKRKEKQTEICTEKYLLDRSTNEKNEKKPAPDRLLFYKMKFKKKTQEKRKSGAYSLEKKKKKQDMYKLYAGE